MQSGLLKVLIIYFAFSSLDTISIFKLQKKGQIIPCATVKGLMKYLI